MNWINKYFEDLKEKINPEELSAWISEFSEIIKNCDGKILFAGNGASSVIGEHAHLDIMNQLGITTINISNGSYITAASNDFGYENIFKRYIDLNVTDKDVVVLISSSGRSKNILNAAEGAKKKGATIVTFSGFSKDNPLRKLGNLNLWVDSSVYNIVESIHNAWIVSVIDYIISENPDNVGIHGIEFEIKGIKQ